MAGARRRILVVEDDSETAEQLMETSPRAAATRPAARQLRGHRQPQRRRALAGQKRALAGLSRAARTFLTDRRQQPGGSRRPTVKMVRCWMLVAAFAVAMFVGPAQAQYANVVTVCPAARATPSCSHPARVIDGPVLGSWNA
jgi:hypothetical protein